MVENVRRGPYRLWFVFLWAVALGLSPKLAAEVDETESPPTAHGETFAADQALGYGDAVILGLVEGITEYLPISSTGHLLLGNELLGLAVEQPLLDSTGAVIPGEDGRPYTMREAADAYAIIIQAGAILAVLILYWGRLWTVANGFLGRDPAGFKLGRNLILAFLPAAATGPFLNDWLETHLFNPRTIAIALAVGAVLMIGVELWRRRKRSAQPGDESASPDLPDLSPMQCLAIGGLQCVAMIPGTSRSMMTIVGGYLVGLKPARAAEFSFLLGLITLSAAAAFKVLTDGAQLLAGLALGPVLLGIAVATVSAMLAVKWLVGFLQTFGLVPFAIYRLVLAAVVLWQLG